jgi:peptidoglycan/xylan/chitin deacetylase (PgdA/CDA1 family)
MRGTIPVLMYHSISDDPEQGIAPYYRIATSPGRFEEHMHWLYQHQFQATNLEDAYRQLAKGMPSTERLVVITFDDGYQDFLTNAWPILDRFGYTATVFLPTELIDDPSSKSFKGRACLGWKDICELQAWGISFGSHTVTHPELYRMPWSQIRKELLDSKLRMEMELQTSIATFSYPYAFPCEDRRFVLRLKEELIDCGYQIAVTTIIGRANPDSDSFSLPRLPINQNDDEALFRAKLEGAYDWMAHVQALIRRLKLFLRPARLKHF